MARFLAVVLAAFLSLAAGQAFAQAGYVHEMRGTVTATTGGATRNLSTGATFTSGTTISTGEKSSVVLKFEDGQIMTLSEKSSFRIAAYNYNKERVRDSNSAFELLAGGLRYISGVIGATRPDAVRLTAGTTTIGIRGTDVNVLIADAVSVAVNAGAVALATPQGEQSLTVGQFSTIGQGQQPSAPAPIAQATAAVQASFTNLASQIVPINTPVVVQASANAAVAKAAADQAAEQLKAQPNNPALQDAAKKTADAAAAALTNAVQQATQAYEAAQKQGGASQPAAPANNQNLPNNLPGPGATGQPGTTGQTGTSGTPSGGAGAGGSGGGGANTNANTLNNSASPN